jgi:hypothetical protein
MDYCGEHGIPHSVFLGRSDGSHWLPEDRAKQLAWVQERSLRCPSCGTAAWEWNPKEGGSKTAYVPDKYTCEGCNRKEHARDSDDPKGTYVLLIPQDVYIERELAKQQEHMTMTLGGEW